MVGFLARLNENVQKMDGAEKQKVVRAVVKQITVGKEMVTIHHSIPLGAACASKEPSSYPLCTRSHQPAVSQHLPEPTGPSDGTGRAGNGTLRGRLCPLVRSEEHTSELQSLRHLVCR